MAGALFEERVQLFGLVIAFPSDWYKVEDCSCQGTTNNMDSWICTDHSIEKFATTPCRDYQPADPMCNKCSSGLISYCGDGATTQV